MVVRLSPCRVTGGVVAAAAPHPIGGEALMGENKSRAEAAPGSGAGTWNGGIFAQ
jgi:hypothetical protein